MVVGILGILKSGAGYVPVDKGCPRERKAFMVGDSGMKCLLCDVMEEEELGVEAVPVRSWWEGEMGGEEGSDPERINGNGDIIYVMYTSDSTGQPKGVVVEHRSVANLVKNTNYTDIQPHHRILQFSNYAFDGSVFDIFSSLLNGACLCMIDRESLLSDDKLREYIRSRGVNIMFITTALLNNFIELGAEDIQYFDKIYFGGENASVSHIRTAL